MFYFLSGQNTPSQTCCSLSFRRAEQGVLDLNAIEAHHLSKNYRVYLKPFDRLKEAFLRKPCHDLVKALTDISFNLPEGGTLGIIGEKRCRKINPAENTGRYCTAHFGPNG